MSIDLRHDTGGMASVHATVKPSGEDGPSVLEADGVAPVPPIPAISVLIPIYNGGQLAEKAYIAIIEALAGVGVCEVIFGNDGSQDDSLELLHTLAKAHDNIRVDTHPNGGLGFTLNRLIAMARADVAVYLDVDLSFDIHQLPQLINAVKHVDIALASRYQGSLKHKIPLSRRVCSVLYRSLSKALLGVTVLDIGSGMVVFLPKAVQQLALTSPGFNWHIEFYDKATRHGLRIMEVPIPYRHGKDGSFRIWKHGPALTRQLLQYAMKRRSGTA